MDANEARHRSGLVTMDGTGAGLPAWKTWSVLLGLCLGMTLLAYVRNEGGPDWAPAPPHEAEVVNVTYIVEGTASAADVTMQTPSGTRQQSAVTLPMVPDGQPAYPPGLVVSGFHSGDFLYVSAQRAYSHGGGSEVTCAIEVNGTVVARNSSSGEFTIVTCQAVAP